MKRYMLCNPLHHVNHAVCIVAKNKAAAMRWFNANGFYDSFNYLKEV